MVHHRPSKLALMRQDGLHMKSETCSYLIPMIESPSLAISVTKHTENQKHISYSVFHTYTQIKWRFSNFVIKSGPSRHICYKTQF